MKKIRYKITALALAGMVSACSDSGSDGPVIKGTVTVTEGESSQTKLYVPAGSEVGYSFQINSAIPLKALEIHRRIGTGINAQEPTRLERIDIKGSGMYTYEFSGTIASIGNDYQYSVYAEDVDGNFNSVRVCVWLDVMRYSQTLTDGASAGTSKTFLNIESGVTYYVANTIGDPRGIDLGFTYMEGTHYQACLVSFDEYYKTGNYGMVVNDLNPWVEFRDATHLATASDFYDQVGRASELQTYFDNGASYDRIMDFSAGRIAHNLWETDMVSFRTMDGRYGLIRIDGIDRRDESDLDNQTMDIRVIVQKNR